jgi:hypothetical protein
MTMAPNTGPLSLWRRGADTVRPARNDPAAVCEVRYEHPVKSGEISSGPGNQRRQHMSIGSAERHAADEQYCYDVQLIGHDRHSGNQGWSGQFASKFSRFLCVF